LPGSLPRNPAATAAGFLFVRRPALFDVFTVMGEASAASFRRRPHKPDAKQDVGSHRKPERVVREQEPTIGPCLEVPVFGSPSCEPRKSSRLKPLPPGHPTTEPRRFRIRARAPAGYRYRR
jgi:hypothetical protein